MPVDPAKYDELKDAMAIDREELDEATMQQPQLFSDVAEQYAMAVSVRDALEDKVKRVEARLTIELRREHEEKAEKLTEAHYKALVLAHKDRRQALKAYLDAAEGVEKWKGLKEAYSMRGHALHDMAKLYETGYFTVSGVRGGAALGKQMNEGRRALINEARQAKAAERPRKFLKA